MFVVTCDWRHHPTPARHTLRHILEHILEREHRIMATTDNLTAALEDLASDVSKLGEDLTTAVQALQDQIAALTVGAISQAQIDALASKAADIDTAVEALDAAVAPAPPTP